MESYGRFASVYDSFMDNVNYREWADYIIQTLGKYEVKDGLVLELGCGTGTVTEMLADAGYDMIGIDNSEEMLAEAMDSENKTLGRIMLDGLKRGFSQPQIEVTFSIDTNGIVNVSARDQATGRAQQITITASGNLSQEEIRRAVEDAARYAEADKKKREETEIKMRGEQLLVDAAQISKKLSKEDRQRIEPMLHDLKAALKAENLSEIREKSEQLRQVLDAVGYSFTGEAGNADDGSYDSEVR